ncbi:MAG: TspO/MBR family protein [Bacteroidota bacterium]|nr:TspO/MBR family protein [Bacteroidota bacterium]
MDLAKELSKKSDIKIKNVYRFVASILLCEAAGLIGYLFTSPAIPTWYIDLVKPSFNPPMWIFGPVWVFIYFLMGISLFFVWKRGIKGSNVFKAAFLFAIQLILNVLWSYIFFGLHNPRAALYEIVVLWGAIAITIVEFFKIRKVAAYLLMPYILWVTFALILNYSIWQLNYR